jgi:glycerophosphoryl diester phosphodiesterase
MASSGREELAQEQEQALRGLLEAAGPVEPPQRTIVTPMAIIGHRGASASLPENTIRAALAALDGGARGSEYDLQQLADGTLVVLHDETLRRTARSAEPILDVPVRELRLADVRDVDVGGERLPLFEEMLRALCARGGLSVVELKAGGERAAMVAEALRVVAAVGAGPAAVLFISFDPDTCARLKRAAPSFRALLVARCASEAEALEALRAAEALGLDGVDLHADPAVVTPELARRAHARGQTLATWVSKAPAPNDVRAVWAHLARADVDLMTTNRPADAVAWAREGDST